MVKKLISVILSIALMISLPITAFADNTLEFNNIKSQVLTNNLQVKNNKMTLQNMKLNRTSPVDSNISGVESATNTAISNMDAIIGNNMSSPELVSIAQSTKMSLSMLNEMYVSTVMQATTGYFTTNHQIALARIQLEHANEQIVNVTQGLFVSYNQLQLNLDSLKANKETLELSVKATELRYTLGLATKLDVYTATKSLTELSNSISDLENQLKVMKGELNKMLGNSFNVELKVGKVPSIDEDYLKNINPELDYKTAKQNSYDLKYLNKELSKIQIGETTAEFNNRNMKKNEIKAKEEALKSSLTQQYNEILKQKNALDVAKKTLSEEKEKFSQIEKKYTLGMASGLALKTQKNTMKAQEANVKIAEILLFWEIESYKTLVNGIAI